MLRTTNVDEINEITFISNPVNRRIKRECQTMRDNYDEIIVEYTINGDILVSFKKINDDYIFNIPSNYPFTAPKVKINGMEQNTFFNLRTNRFKTVLKYVSGLDCLCCHTYLCKNNWSPAISMKHIIKQIEEYKTFKHFIFIKFILDKIKEKYLHRDIDLDSWLFNIYDQRMCYPGKAIH